jgi:hypothetical protein
VLIFESIREIFDDREIKSLTFFSAVGVCTFAEPPTAVLKSKAPPGVFGAFEDPKEANAPEPRPNALDAPVVGDAREVVDGDMALKGFLLLWEEVREEGNIRSLGGRVPLVEEEPVAKESLLELLDIC